MSIRKYFRRAQWDRERADELQNHIDLMADDLEARGMAREEAVAAARRSFGNRTAPREQIYDTNSVPVWETIARDLSYAVRVFRKSPVFTFTAIATLAIAIGANTAVFSIVDSLLLRPLRYPEPERLALVVTRYARGVGFNTSQDGRTWELIRDQVTAVDAATHAGTSRLRLTANGSVRYVERGRVSAGYFRVLGIGPAMGREFTGAEDQAGGPAVALISERVWRTVFGGNRGAIGGTITLGDDPHTIVGVVPGSFPGTVDVWTPLRPSATGEGAGNNYGLIARIRPGHTWEEASAQIERAAAPRMVEIGPKDAPGRAGLAPLQEAWTQDTRKPALVLWGAVGLVLLIACVNLAGLLIARGAGRSREVATRIALGCGRRGVVRQLLMESLLLASAGGIAGLGLGMLALAGLKQLGGGMFNLSQVDGLDGRVLAATVALTFLTGILFGLAPALGAARVNLRGMLAEGGARGVAGSRKHTARRVLVVAEVALGMVLLISAGLLLRTFAKLRGLEPGFDSRNVIAATMPVQGARYGTAAAMTRFYSASLDRIDGLPGVASSAVALGLPYTRLLNTGIRVLDGPRAGERLLTNLIYVTPGYFETLRIPLLRGRVFGDGDRSGSAGVAVVNESFARSYLEGGAGLGSRVGLGRNDQREVVGIVGNTQQRPGWGDFGPLATPPIVYIPVAQTDDQFLALVHTWFQPSWIVRASGAADAVMPGVQRAMEQVDPLMPFSEVRMLEDTRADSTAYQRFLLTLVGTMAAIALLLAAIGIYGLIASSVAERTREFGIRLALGATAGQTIGSVTRQGVLLAAAGAIAGCALARAAAGLIGSLIWGVSATDLTTYAAVAFGLIAVAAASSLLPALRLLRLDPARTLRED